VKDETLNEAWRKLSTTAGQDTKFDVDLELSERPARNPASEFLFARLNVDTHLNRGNLFGSKEAGRLFGSMSPDKMIFHSFLTTVKKVAFSLEFDSLDDFWTSVVLPSSPGLTEPYMQKVGWHSLAYGVNTIVKELRMNKAPFNQKNEMIDNLYKELVGNVAGFHGLHLVLGSDGVVEVKGNNFDIFHLLPTYAEYEQFPLGNAVTPTYSQLD